MNISPFNIKTIRFRSKMRILSKFPSSVCCHLSFSPPTPIRSPPGMAALEMLLSDATILYVYGVLWRHKDKDSHSSRSTARAECVGGERSRAEHVGFSYWSPVPWSHYTAMPLGYAAAKLTHARQKNIKIGKMG